MAATQLIDAGVVPLSLYEGTKKPVGNGWQNSTIPTAAQLADMFPDDTPRNLGALLGQASGNIFSPDFDVYPAYARWREHKPPESRTIFSARSTRPIFRTEPEALAKGNMMLDGVRIGELLADRQHVVMPPSRLKDGFEYTDNGLAIAYMPPDHPAFLALIKLTERHYSEQIAVEIAQGKRKPARFAQAALDGRIPTSKRYPTRSELDAAIIQSLARSGFDADEIYVKLDTANLHSHWHERKESSRRAEIARVIAKFAGTNSPASLEALKRADTLAAYRTHAAWPRNFDTGKTRIIKATGEIKPVRVTGRTVEAVLLAHEMKVRDCLTHTYQLDTRAGDGRFANIGRKPFERATKLLLSDGVLRRIKAAKGTCAHVYEVPTETALARAFKAQATQWLPDAKAELTALQAELKRVTAELESAQTPKDAKRHKSHQTAIQGKVNQAATRVLKLENSIAVGHFNTIPGGPAKISVEVADCDTFSAGVFDFSGLGQTAFRIYRAALDSPLTARQLALLIGLHVQTVQRTLKRLARYGLVEKHSGRRWQSDANVNWQAVGDYLNTTARIQDKQVQTRERREARASSYKLHCPQHAHVPPDSELPADLNTSAKRAKVKAKNNVNRHGAKWETLEPARQRADLADLQNQVNP